MILNFSDALPKDCCSLTRTAVHLHVHEEGLVLEVAEVAQYIKWDRTVAWANASLQGLCLNLKLVFILQHLEKIFKHVRLELASGSSREFERDIICRGFSVAGNSPQWALKNSQLSTFHVWLSLFVGFLTSCCPLYHKTLVTKHVNPEVNSQRN